MVRSNAAGQKWHNKFKLYAQVVIFTMDWWWKRHNKEWLHWGRERRRQKRTRFVQKIISLEYGGCQNHRKRTHKILCQQIHIKYFLAVLSLVLSDQCRFITISFIYWQWVNCFTENRTHTKRKLEFHRKGRFLTGKMLCAEKQQHLWLWSDYSVRAHALTNPNKKNGNLSRLQCT